MKTYECHGCGNILKENEECCKYCGSANPIFVASAKSKSTSFAIKTNDEQDSDKTAHKSFFLEGGSIGLGLVLGIFLFWIGLIIAVVLRKKKTFKGAIIGSIIIFVLWFVIVLAGNLVRY